jgi:hypothetical protein
MVMVVCDVITVNSACYLYTECKKGIPTLGYYRAFVIV